MAATCTYLLLAFSPAILTVKNLSDSYFIMLETVGIGSVIIQHRTHLVYSYINSYCLPVAVYRYRTSLLSIIKAFTHTLLHIPRSTYKPSDKQILCNTLCIRASSLSLDYLYIFSPLFPHRLAISNFFLKSTTIPPGLQGQDV